MAAAFYKLLHYARPYCLPVRRFLHHFCFVFPVGCRHFSEANLNAIDQTWYKRAVDQYSVEPDSFVYSVPFSTGTGM